MTFRRPPPSEIKMLALFRCLVVNILYLSSIPLEWQILIGRVLSPRNFACRPIVTQILLALKPGGSGEHPSSLEL